jgi:hypothetical protein
VANFFSQKMGELVANLGGLRGGRLKKPWEILALRSPGDGERQGKEKAGQEREGMGHGGSFLETPLLCSVNI